MNLDERARRSRKKRVIDLLRGHVPGVWRYEWPSRWVHETGVAVQAFSTCSISVTGFETYDSVYRRSDTGEVVHPFTGLGLKQPFEKQKELGSNDWRPM